MTFTGGTKATIEALASKAHTLGVFGTVRGSEPKVGPADNSLVCAFWVANLRPIPQMSGLAETTWRLEVTARIYDSNAFSPVSDFEIGDSKITDAAVDLLESYTRNFTLDGQVSQVDLLGAYGTPLQVTFGYINQDGKLYRNADVTIPLVMSEEWDQAS